MSSLENNIWNRHHNFNADRHSMALIQSPHKISHLLHGEVVEVAQALEHLSSHPQSEEARYELLFELADVYIYTMSMAQLLKREDLEKPMESHLIPGDTNLHTMVDTMSAHDKGAALTLTANNLRQFMDATPDHEMDSHDEIFTKSIVSLAALTGSMVQDFSEIPFADVINAKLAYNEYRYPAHEFAYPQRNDRFHFGPDAFAAYNGARLRRKALEPTLEYTARDFLERSLKAA